MKGNALYTRQARWLKQGESQIFKAWEKKGDFPTNATVFKWHKLFFVDNRCRWWLLNKLTRKCLFFFFSVTVTTLVSSCEMSRSSYHSQCTNNSKIQYCHIRLQEVNTLLLLYRLCQMSAARCLFIILSDTVNVSFLFLALFENSHSLCICQILHP